VDAVSGVHWLGADGALAGGVFVLDAALDEAGEAALTALGRRLEAQLRLREVLARQRELVETTDALTGILNRKGFDAALATEWLRARRARAAVALLLFEMDGFGKLNAVLGHEAGDEALRRVAGCVRDVVSRAGDVVARFSEDGFAVLLAEVNPSRTGAAVVAERCRAAVESLALPNGAGGTLTVSGGAVTMVADALEPTRLLQRADSALYMAKDRGGNRICAFAGRLAEAGGAM
jgi:diguanylate cyclase (GGDEF)-like protein